MKKFDEMASARGRRVQVSPRLRPGGHHRDSLPYRNKAISYAAPPAVTTTLCSWHLSLLQRSDPQLLAQFYYADEELNQVAAELDSLDGRKEPQRCTLLVSQFRSCQVSGTVGASGYVSILGSS